MSAGTVRHRAMITIAVLVLGVAWSPAARADRGAIRVISDVDIAEPAQRAIIAHDGLRELLILQTEVVASADTTLVEFMPLPSKPEVSAATEDCFATLQEIAKAKRMGYGERGPGGAGRQDEEELLEIVVRTQIGAHDVTVVKTRKEWDEWQ